MTPWVKRLLLANVAVFFIQLTVGQRATQFLAFIPSLALVRPWSFVTYMFAHSTTSVTHILFNMLVLYFFGPRVEERLGSGHFVRLYFISGIVGAILSIVFNQGGYIIGASGAVFGVQLAFAKYWPRERIYIWGILPVEAWLLVVDDDGARALGWVRGRRRRRRALRAPRRLPRRVALSIVDGAPVAGSGSGRPRSRSRRRRWRSGTGRASTRSRSTRSTARRSTGSSTRSARRASRA